METYFDLLPAELTTEIDRCLQFDFEREKAKANARYILFQARIGMLRATVDHSLFLCGCVGHATWLPFLLCGYCFPHTTVSRRVGLFLGIGALGILAPAFQPLVQLVIDIPYCVCWMYFLRTLHGQRPQRLPKRHN